MTDSFNTFISEFRRDGAESGPLAGKTIAVKDNISTADTPTTCGSRMLESYHPPYDATVVKRVLDAGATIVGTTNMDEFGMGSTTETSAFGPTRNPRAPEHVPGGSSGGSAAAVAAGQADLALGTDTGGSIRNPAAYCGVVGLKPTYGCVSRYGLVAYAHSLEQIGPIGDTIQDVATLYDVIAGQDDRDATTGTNSPVGSVTSLSDRPEEPVIGIPRQLVDGVDDEVLNQFWEAIAMLEEEGWQRQELDLKSLDLSVAAYYVIAMSEASSNLARFDGVRYGYRADDEGDWNDVFSKNRSAGFGSEVTRRILLGTFALSAGYQEKYYEQAQSARNWVAKELTQALESVHAIVSPTMPTIAPQLGDSLDDPLRTYLADANTVPANLSRLPALSVPIGTVSGLPVGLQLLGPELSEERLLSMGQVIESLS